MVVGAKPGTNPGHVTVTVPPGYLQDIVKPYWGERVEVVAHRTHGHLESLDINPTEAGQ